MVLMVVCGVLLTAGLVLALRWRGEVFVPPSKGPLGQTTAWYLVLAAIAGGMAGLAVMGGGGRLAMRLLAATANDAAQGRITEADETVGVISTEGTIGFLIFVGLIGGMLLGTGFLVVRPLLSRGRWAGLLYGGLLVAVVATRGDPLRPGNRDFDLVGPGWLAVVVFLAVVLGYGLVIGAVAARISRSLPVLGGAGWLRWYLPVAVVMLPFGTFAAPVLVLVGIAMALARWAPVARVLAAPRALLAGRAGLLGVVGLALPWTVADLLDIAGRG